MKSLIVTCASCVLLAGAYFTVKNRDEVKKLVAFTKPESFTFNALPTEQQSAANRKPNIDAETSLPPVETLPVQTNSFPVINSAATPAVPVENKQEAISNTLVDSNWIDYSVFEKEAASVANAFTEEEPEPAQPAETEQKSIINNVPFVEQGNSEMESVMETRRLIMNLNPERVDSAVRHNTPVVSRKMATHTAAILEEEKETVVYAPSQVVSEQVEVGRESYSYSLLYERAERIKAYAARKGYDTSYAFMIDMGMKSGKKRFFVMDLNTMTIVKRGMVAHGRGNENFTFNKTYSNASGSNCTSLGMYKVGAQYQGSYGTSFKLTGLEATNNNAAKRSIILHSKSCIPYGETEYPIAQSQGCPSVAPGFLKEIAPIIASRHQPMLMWIYDPMAEGLEEEMVANY